MRNKSTLTSSNIECIWQELVSNKRDQHTVKIEDIFPIEHIKIQESGKYYSDLTDQQFQFKQEQYYDAIYALNPLMSQIAPLIYDIKSTQGKDVYIALFDKEGYSIASIAKEKLGVRCSASALVGDLLGNGNPIRVLSEHNLSPSLKPHDLIQKQLIMDYSGGMHESCVFPVYDNAGQVIGGIAVGNFSGSLTEEIVSIGYWGAMMFQYKYRYLTEFRSDMNSLLNGLPIGAFLMDENAHIVSANLNFCDMLGLSDRYSPSVYHIKNISGEEILTANQLTLKEKVTLRTIYNQIVPCSVLSQQVVNLNKVGKHLLVLIQKDSQSVYLNSPTNSAFDSIIGNSTAIKNIKAKGKRVARTPSNVLIEGKSGTGKELLAEAIHKESGLTGAFIPINCGAISKELLQSELFGYEDGAFTGAKRGGKAGLLEQADGGTIFLDEIGEMPIDMQVHLLRFLQDRIVRRVGGNKRLKVNVRIIAATNRDLFEEVQLGNFREDLYYRLCVVNITMPTLKERKEDIPLLVQDILKELCCDFNIEQPKIAQPVMDIFFKHSWPGNVRELKNVIESSLTVFQGDTINKNDLPPNLTRNKIITSDNNGTFKGVIASKNSGTLKQVEKTAIINSLNEYQGNISKVAKSLGISRPTLYSKLNEHSIQLIKEIKHY